MLCIYRKTTLCIHLFPLPRTSLSPPALSGATARGQQHRVPSGAVMIRYPHPARLPLPIYHHIYCTQLPSFGGQSCPDPQPGHRLFKANIFTMCPWKSCSGFWSPELREIPSEQLSGCLSSCYQQPSDGFLMELQSRRHPQDLPTPKVCRGQG